MSKREQVPVKWDKDKKWEELQELCFCVIVRKEIKTVYVNPEDEVVAEPGIRYFMSENGGSKQPFLEELTAMILSILFSGVVAILTIIFIIGYYSKKARSTFAIIDLRVVVLLLSLLTLLIPCKVYDVSVLKWKIWNCLYDYFSQYELQTEKCIANSQFPDFRLQVRQKAEVLIC